MKQDKSRQKILMICNTDAALCTFRYPLIQKLKKDGYIISTISSKSEYHKELESFVQTAHYVNIDNSLNPFSLIKLIRSLYHIILVEKPDIVHNFTHKPCIYGTIAARKANVKKIYSTITGLGRVFTYHTLKHKFLQQIMYFQYNYSQKYATKVFFQNTDDLNQFVSKKIIPAEKALLTNGSAIDLEVYTLSDFEEKKAFRSFIEKECDANFANKPIVIFPARAIIEKGVEYFYEAAEKMNKQSNNYIFIHLGGPYGKSKYSEENLLKKAKHAGVYYLGYRTDIKNFLMGSDIVVLPSFYREGVPHSLIEGMALGNIILTTDLPGCRETVEQNYNG